MRPTHLIAAAVTSAVLLTGCATIADKARQQCAQLGLADNPTCLVQTANQLAISQQIASQNLVSALSSASATYELSRPRTINLNVRYY